MHGIFSVITRCCSGFFQKIPKAINWLITFLFVNAAWVFFRAESIQDALTLLQKPFQASWGAVSSNISGVFLLPEFEVFLGPIRVFRFLETHTGICAGIFFGCAMALILKAKNAYQHMCDDQLSF